MNKPFGYSYLLDMYDARHAEDLEISYRFLEQLVELLGMKRTSQLFVMHGPTPQGDEPCPDKGGVSALAPLVESSINIQSLARKRFIMLDVSSRRHFNPDTVFDFARRTFHFQNHEAKFIERGSNYVERGPDYYV